LLLLFWITTRLYVCRGNWVGTIWHLPEERTSSCPALLQLAKDVKITASLIRSLTQLVAHLIHQIAESLPESEVVQKVVLEIVQYPMA
jgi:hypothetical protein